ncbi:hypothetical protein GCM10027614_76820 [Micromonospora vulcania]
MPPLRRPDAVPPTRRPGPEPTEPGRPLPTDNGPAGRRATGPATDPARAAAPGPARFDVPPAVAVPPIAEGPRPDPAVDRDPRIARRRPGPVDPGAPEPVGRRPGDRARPAAGGRRRAAESDDPAVPRSGNAPSVPDAFTGHSGATPTVGPSEGTGRRRAVPDEQERPAPAGGEPRADRPERPADWLRQAGRLPHTDPGLPVVNRRGGNSPAGRRPVPPASDLNDGSSGRLAVPDPAAEVTANRRPAGPPPDPGAPPPPAAVPPAPVPRIPPESSRAVARTRRPAGTGPPGVEAVRCPAPTRALDAAGPRRSRAWTAPPARADPERRTSAATTRTPVPRTTRAWWRPRWSGCTGPGCRPFRPARSGSARTGRRAGLGRRPSRPRRSGPRRVPRAVARMVRPGHVRMVRLVPPSGPPVPRTRPSATTGLARPRG